MKTVASYKKKVVKNAEAFLKDGLSAVEEIEKSIEELFPYGPGDLSKASESFEKELLASSDGSNSVLEKALPVVRDYLAKSIDETQLLERYISLHVPAMEDGNNFGVSVQMVVAKHLKSIREGAVKRMESLPKYYSERSDALDKVGIKKTTESITKSSSSSSSTGGKDGDEKKQSTTEVSESKESGSSKPDPTRIKHVVALDVFWYNEMRSTLTALVASYLTIFDNMEKNKDKLTAPKGSGGSGLSMAMY